MAKTTPITTKDCSPFENIPAKSSEAIKKLSEYFIKTYPDSKNDDLLVSFRTFQNTNKEVETSWWAGRYIGIANVDNYEISIHPRFGEGFLLKVIEDVYNIKTFGNDAKTENGNTVWFSSLLNILRGKIWIEKCTAANRYGIPRKNIKKTHQGVDLKGSIDIPRSVMPWSFKNEIVTNKYEKDFDERICRIVYEAYKILSKNVTQRSATQKTRNKGSDNSFAITTTMPPAVQNAINTLSNNFKGTLFNIKETNYRRIKYNSIYASWKPLVDFSWDVIQNRNMSLKNSSIVSDCVFVDMAEIWEAFLRKKLGEGLKDDGWSVWTIEECKQLHIYEGSFFRTKIIPDIVLQRNVNGEKQFLVLDAKYKRMKGEKIDVDRTDFFQIHTYMQYFQHAYPQGKVLLGGLLYPVTKDEIEKEIDKCHHLFGKEGGKFDTKFIIDGIVCNDDAENFNGEIMENSIQEMIERIRKHISNFE